MFIGHESENKREITVRIHNDHIVAHQSKDRVSHFEKANKYSKLM